MDTLKYLPVTRCYVTKRHLYDEEFIVRMNPEDVYKDGGALWGQRKLLLLLQRHYRKMIWDLRGNYEDYILGIYEDVTVTHGLYDFRFTCRTVLLPKEEFVEWIK